MGGCCDREAALRFGMGPTAPHWAPMSVGKVGQSVVLLGQQSTWSRAAGAGGKGTSLICGHLLSFRRGSCVPTPG